MIILSLWNSCQSTEQTLNAVDTLWAFTYPRLLLLPCQWSRSEHLIESSNITPWIFFFNREKFLNNSNWDVDYFQIWRVLLNHFPCCLLLFLACLKSHHIQHYWHALAVIPLLNTTLFSKIPTVLLIGKLHCSIHPCIDKIKV